MNIRYISLDVLEMSYCNLLKVPRVPYVSKGSVEFTLDYVRDLYQDLEIKDAVIAKSAYLWHTFASNQYFGDGNKRIGVHLAEMMLESNGWLLIMNEDDKTDLALRVANSQITIDQLRHRVKDLIKEKRLSE